jgi:hypothetical protein
MRLRHREEQYAICVHFFLWEALDRPRRSRSIHATTRGSRERDVSFVVRSNLIEVDGGGYSFGQARRSPDVPRPSLVTRGARSTSVARALANDGMDSNERTRSREALHPSLVRSRTNEWTQTRTNERTNERANERANERTNERTRSNLVEVDEVEHARLDHWLLRVDQRVQQRVHPLELRCRMVVGTVGRRACPQWLPPARGRTQTRFRAARSAARVRQTWRGRRVRNRHASTRQERVGQTRAVTAAKPRGGVERRSGGGGAARRHTGGAECGVAWLSGGVECGSW